MQHKTIEYFDGSTCLEGYLAYDENQTLPRPGILVVHDWSGLNEHVKERADRLAKSGYVALAVDMFGDAKVGETNEEKMALISPFLENRKTVVSRMQAAIEALKQQKQVNPNQLASLGFCFGGMCSLDAARGGCDLKAVISFHGDLSEADFETVSPIKTKLLALHGHDDPMIPPENVLAFEKEMDAAQAEWQLHIYSGVQHAFTNKLAHDYKLGTVYNELADKRSWISCCNFLEEVF